LLVRWGRRIITSKDEEWYVDEELNHFEVLVKVAAKSGVIFGREMLAVELRVCQHSHDIIPTPCSPVASANPETGLAPYDSSAPYSASSVPGTIGAFNTNIDPVPAVPGPTPVGFPGINSDLSP
jgi:hypothetical protein